MDIMYTINHSFVEIAAVSISSLIMNNSDKKLHFHIVTLDFTVDDYKFLDKLINNDNVEVSYYPLENYNIEEFEIPSWKGNQVANARLFFQDILETSRLDKLLYLDADTIVNGDLSSILKYKGTVNAVLETMFKYRLEALNLKRYFNSGVLLIDIEKWLERDFLKTLIDYRTKNPHIPLNYPDQDLLNLAIGNDINPIPLRYNLPVYALMDRFNFNEKFYGDKRKINSGIDLNEELANALIYHSWGPSIIKPWVQNKVNPLNKDFDKYMELINPDFNKEKLNGLKNFLVNNPSLFCFLLNLKLNVLPEKTVQVIEGYNISRRRKK